MCGIESGFVSAGWGLGWGLVGLGFGWLGLVRGLVQYRQIWVEGRGQTFLGN